NKIGLAKVDPRDIQPEHHVVIDAIGRSARIKGKFRGKYIPVHTGSQSSNAPIARDTGFLLALWEMTVAVEHSQIRTLPMLHHLLSNSRLALHQFGMPRECIAAK